MQIDACIHSDTIRPYLTADVNSFKCTECGEELPISEGETVLAAAKAHLRAERGMFSG